MCAAAGFSAGSNPKHLELLIADRPFRWILLCRGQAANGRHPELASVVPPSTVEAKIVLAIAADVSKLDCNSARGVKHPQSSGGENP